MADGIANAGYDFLSPVNTNMIFPTFPTKVVDALREQYEFYDQKNAHGMTTVRMVTSWATPEGVIDEFIAFLIASAP
jgi:threonine aldolase